ncbi:DUF6880 family protein [Synechococcus sp. CCY 0621]|uniref:DUF6880 family protein n=1 Tax=Synechococcus sp. CCY 0621 TaxID=2815603 RepID=UPI001C241EFA|nr:DUF6880 family protein [Synechococcus sp. CCY 0621]
MASKLTLNAQNLETLGARRLAELLIELSSGNAAAKRQLRLALAAGSSPAEAAREVRKRLASIARSTTYVDWRKRKALVADLDSQRCAITGPIAEASAAEAVELLWRFLDLADGIYERCDDSSGTVGAVFERAIDDLARLARASQMDPIALGERCLEAVHDNGYGQYDNLITLLAPALGEAGLAYLQQQLAAIGPDVSYSSSTLALQAIADARGDVDAYLATFDARARRQPAIAAEMARRLLAAGRPEQALALLNDADTAGRRWVDEAWEQSRIEALEALGRTEEAQASRWSHFERSLSLDQLRAYLRRLPDFEDVEAEQRALALAADHPSGLQALAFLLQWPAVSEAAALVLRRHSEWDGESFELFNAGAERLAGRHPLAASLLLRRMIDFALDHARVKRYRYAAQHLHSCALLDAAIDDYGEHPTHRAYVAELRERHGRKWGFWQDVDPQDPSD